MNELPPLQRILALTGPALLLPWPRGSKGAPRRWGHMQLALMDDRVHLSLLEKAGNIGVALGKVSGGLVSIDIDQDERVPEFLELNPLLSETLRTKGARGCNVWVRMKGDYPPTHKLKDKGRRSASFGAIAHRQSSLERIPAEPLIHLRSRNQRGKLRSPTSFFLLKPAILLKKAVTTLQRQALQRLRDLEDIET